MRPRAAALGKRLRRTSPDWGKTRQTIEHFFKGAKESRRLEDHRIRGLRQVTLHALMSVPTLQATALVKVQAGREADMPWMVRKIAQQKSIEHLDRQLHYTLYHPKTSTSSQKKAT